MRIRDTGVGMTEKDIETALEPFRQIATSSRGPRGDGTGLGLPLTKALVEANRASLRHPLERQAGTLVRDHLSADAGAGGIAAGRARRTPAGEPGRSVIAQSPRPPTLIERCRRDRSGITRRSPGKPAARVRS